MKTVTYNTLATRQGEDADYIHMRMQGTQVETLRVIRGETQTRDTEGSASYLKREGKLVFKIKPEMTKQCAKNKRNHGI